MNNFKICSFNTNGAKRNLNFLQLLINQNDFIFLCETWLLDYESEKYLNSLSSTHDFLHKSDMNIAPLKGRPYGGRTFIIKKHINVKNYNFINKHLAFITLELNKKKFTFISVYLPFDNNTNLNFTEFQSSLQIILELFLFYSLNRHLVFIIGDFNADVTRNNRFDLLFKNFINNNELSLVSPSFNINEFSYHNDHYKAKLDHCIISKSLTSPFIHCVYNEDVINLSDHKSILIMINFYDDTAIHKEINNNEEIKFITLNPNLEIDEVNDKFNNILANEMDKYCNHVINDPSNKQQMINDMYLQLTNAIKFAYSSCSRIITLKSLKKTKWFTTELKQIKKNYFPFNL